MKKSNKRQMKCEIKQKKLEVLIKEEEIKRSNFKQMTKKKEIM